MIAYTVGGQIGYDDWLAEDDEPLMKVGRCRMKGWQPDEKYPGGIIFRSPDDAQKKAVAYTEKHGRTFAVYEVELESWDDDVYAHPEHGFCLKVDREVVHKVES